MKVVLLDLDGTILTAHGAGARAMTRAGCALFGKSFSLENVDFSGRLDPHIIEDGLRRSGLSPDDERRSRFPGVYAIELARELRETQIEIHDGVADLIEMLALRTDTLLGLLTGNFARAAETKLEIAQIDIRRFALLNFGDEAPTRTALAALALSRAREVSGVSIVPTDVVVVGDTPRDIACARDNAMRMLAVATGRFSVEELSRHGPTRVVTSLRDQRPLIEMLRGPEQLDDI
jgi:phosphoglycolate phosphatase